MSQKTNIQFDNKEKAEEILRLFSELNDRDKGKLRGVILSEGNSGRDIEVRL